MANCKRFSGLQSGLAPISKIYAYTSCSGEGTCQRRAVHAADASQPEQRRDHRRARIAGRDERVRFAILHQVKPNSHRVLCFLVARFHHKVFALVVHRQHFGRVDNADG